MTEPTQAQWQALYQAAAAFRDLAPWVWMTDKDLFAVEDPVTGEVGYGGVMGSGGQEFGLHVFIGAEGFDGFCKMVDDEVEPESMEAAMLMRSVAVAFESREMLDRRDHEVVRALGLRFRGRGVWPWFRSQRPGYAPWYLDDAEAKLLEVALRQGLEVAQRVKTRGLQLSSGMDDQPVLTRCFRQGAWVDEWCEPPTWRPPWEELAPPDELRLKQLQQAAGKSRNRWQMDLFYLPTPIGERGQRPYFPRMLLVVNRQGLIVGNELLEPWVSATERQEAVFKVLERAPGLPQEIQVGREEVQRLLRPMATALGVKVRFADLGAIEAVKEELFESFT
jgi:hypothetical protein